jgi:hypothetical protein
MNNFSIEPVDPLVKDDSQFFYADEKMLNILINEDIQVYLDYVNNKYKASKNLKEKITNPTTKEILDKHRLIHEYDRIERQNEYKKHMLDSIWLNIMTLEETINKLKPKT